MEYLSRQKKVMGGALCIKGTRIPMSVILYRLSEGKTIQHIQELYPHLTEVKISLAIKELGDVIDKEVAK